MQEDVFFTTTAWRIVRQTAFNLDSLLPSGSVKIVLTPEDHFFLPTTISCQEVPRLRHTLNSTWQLLGLADISFSTSLVLQCIFKFNLNPIPSLLSRFFPSPFATQLMDEMDIEDGKSLLKQHSNEDRVIDSQTGLKDAGTTKPLLNASKKESPSKNATGKKKVEAPKQTEPQPTFLPTTKFVPEVPFDYYLMLRTFPRCLLLQEWFSYKFPKHFYFMRVSIFEPILDSANVFYALVTPDFQSLVFVQPFERTNSVRFIPVFFYKKQTYALFYKVSTNLPSESVPVPFLLVFLVQQILIDFLIYEPAPFLPTRSVFDFKNANGSYQNVYFTPESLSQSFWLIHLEFFPDCPFLIDVAQGNYHPSTHVSMFDIPWNFHFFLNGDFGVGNLFAPHSGILPVAKSFSQAELFDKKGYVIVSRRIHDILMDFNMLPANCVTIFPVNNVAFFNARGKQLPPSPCRQVFYCIGFESASYSVVLNDNAFILPEKLKPRSFGFSSLNYLKHISQILTNFRSLEFHLSRIENLVCLDVDILDVPLAKLARHYPRFGFTFKQLRGLQAGKIQLPVTALFQPRAYRSHQKIAYVNKKHCLSIRDRLQKGHFCSFCASSHLKRCCLFCADNYKPYDEYTRDLWAFFKSFQPCNSVFFAGVPIAKLRKGFEYLRLAEKFFWASFLKRFPHHTTPSPGFTFFIDTSRKVGWLWAIQAPLWVVGLAICGIFNPYMQHPFPVIVDPGPPPSRDQWHFWTSKVDEFFDLHFAVPSSKAQNRTVSNSFLINWDVGELGGRPRLIINFVFLNRLFPAYKFSLLTIRQLLARFASSGNFVFNYDVRKAYETMKLSPLTWQDFGVWVWYQERWQIIQLRAPMFGANFYPVLFNAKHKAETEYLLRFHLTRYSSYDNGLIFVQTQIWHQEHFAELLNYICEFFIKIQSPLNSEYGMKITPITKFLGKYVDFFKQSILPALRSMRKFLHVLHGVLWTRTISCADASKCAGIFLSIGEHPLHRSMSRVFYNFLMEHTPLHDWRRARQNRSPAWLKKHPLPENILQVLKFWSLLIYRPDFLEDNWNTATLARFEIVSDANPQYGATTNWLNDRFLSRSVFFSPQDVHSYQFELSSLKNAVYQLDSEMRKFERGTVSVTLKCDNRATIRHLNHGAPQFVQNQVVLELMTYFASLNIRFTAIWKHRSFEEIQDVDLASRLPTIAEFVNNSSFSRFIRVHFPNINFKMFFVSNLECSQVISHFAQFWTKLQKWDFSKAVPIFGPIFDNHVLHFVIPKLLKFGQPILFCVPRFYNCLFYQSLLPVCTFIKLPFDLVSASFKSALLRYPLELAFFHP